MKQLNRDKQILTAHWLSIGLLVMIGLLGFSGEAYALAPLKDGVCTDSPLFNPPGGSTNLITIVLNNLKNILTSLSSGMFNSIVANGSFQALVGAAISLYIVIYGILFTLGLAELSVYDLAIRFVKLGIVSQLLSPGAWGFFMFYLNGVFVAGGDQLISMMTAVGIGGVTGMGGSTPFSALDSLVEKITNAKTSVSMTGMMVTGAYGGAFFALMLWGVVAIVKALLEAAWVYIMSITMLTLLFGTAPIFIACLLFSRTKYLFDGWKNQVVNAILQPVLLFTFFAFFASLVTSTLNKITQAKWCWSGFDDTPGTSVKTHGWRYVDDNEITVGNAPEKAWDFTGTDTNLDIVFPIDIIDVLTFVLLTQLCSSMNKIVLQIAKSIAGASTDMNMSGMAQNVMTSFQQAGGGGKGGGKKGGKGK